MADVQSGELERIEEALNRMREGTFGECGICGGNIPLERLNALPYALNCINCQREAEGGDTGRRGTKVDFSYPDDQSDTETDVTPDLPVGDSEENSEEEDLIPDIS
jgi:DnaK suppressor protein